MEARRFHTISSLGEYQYGERIARQGKLLVGSSAIVLDQARQKILLIKRTDNGRWSIPGGAIDPGESVQEACVREVKEETGLDVEITNFVGVYSDPNRLLVYPDGNRYHLISLAFEVRVTGGQLTPNSEASDFLWAPIDQVEQLDLVQPQLERIRDALSGGPVVR